jgi:hypothetical protein
MSLLREQSSVLLDAAMSEADEAIAVFEDIARHVDNDDARLLLESAASDHGRLLEGLRESRRSHGDLPSLGDPERGHLRALAAEAQALLQSVVDPTDTDSVRIDRLIETLSSARDKFAQIPNRELTSSELQLIDAYRRSSEALEAALMSIIDAG